MSIETLVGRGFVAIWNDVVPQARQDFLDWHLHEHMPERLAIPGFRRGSRYGAPAPHPGFFTLYILDGPEVARSPAYLARLDAPTPWTHRVMQSYRDNARCVGRFVASAGAMPGDELLVVRLRVFPSRLSQAVDDCLSRLSAIPGVSGCHMGSADATASALPSAERDGRSVAEPAGLILLALAPGHDPRTAVAESRSVLGTAFALDDAIGTVDSFQLQLDMRPMDGPNV